MLIGLTKDNHKKKKNKREKKYIKNVPNKSTTYSKATNELMLEGKKSLSLCDVFFSIVVRVQEDIETNI